MKILAKDEKYQQANLEILEIFKKEANLHGVKIRLQSQNWILFGRHSVAQFVIVNLIGIQLLGDSPKMSLKSPFGTPKGSGNPLYYCTCSVNNEV